MNDLGGTIGASVGIRILVRHYTYVYPLATVQLASISEVNSTLKCDPLSKNPALPANIEVELEAILSVQVVF